MDKNLLMSLARQLNLTDLESESEEYILTEKEEQTAISHEIKRLRDHKMWKLKGAGLPELDVLGRIAAIDFSAEINREEVLKRANSNKQYGLWQSKQRENEKIAEADSLAKLKEEWSAKKMFALLKWTSENVYGKKLLVTEDNKRFITAVCYFLSNDPRFESELGYSQKKGLLIRGISGLGKTHIIRCLAENKLNPILVLSMIEISDEIKHEGEYSIELAGKKLIYLDDVGSEEPVINHFGTKISYFKTFIESYYLRNKTYNRLLISTNNSFSEMEERYGFRVRSRIKDMFNIIDVAGKDMRG